MDSGHLVVRAVVVDRVHLGGVGVDSALPVLDDGAILPRTLPELVDDLHEFIGEVVALVVSQLARVAQVPRGGFEVAGDNVPADAPACEVVKRGELAGQCVGLFVGQRAGHREPEVLGHRRHRGDLHERVVQRDLVGVQQCRGAGVLVDVVDSQHVGQEEGVEAAGLEGLCQGSPVFEGVVGIRLIFRVAPEPGALVGRGGHVEGIEGNALCHGVWGFFLVGALGCVAG